MNTDHLIVFYGKECDDCIRMEPLLARLEFEEGIILLRKEVWHDSKNELEMLTYDKDNACGGIPFFINTKTNEILCGQVSYTKLKNWALSNGSGE